MRALKKNDRKQLNLKFVKNPKFYIPASIFMGIVVVGIAGILIWKPGVAKGEYDIQSIVDMLLNHDQRIKNIETKTDNTQTQTNQNSEDIKKIQENTGTTPATTVPTATTPITSSNPIAETSTTTVIAPTATTTDPNNNSWANGHGTFVYKNFLTTSSARLGKDFVYNGLNYYNRKQCNFTLPAGTIGYKDYHAVNLEPMVSYDYLANSLIFDLSPYYPNGICGTKSWQQYFSNNMTSTYFPGNLDIWW